MPGSSSSSSGGSSSNSRCEETTTAGSLVLLVPLWCRAPSRHHSQSVLASPTPNPTPSPTSGHSEPTVMQVLCPQGTGLNGCAAVLPPRILPLTPRQTI